MASSNRNPSAPITLPEGWQIRIRGDVFPPTALILTPEAPEGMELSDPRVPAQVRRQARLAIARDTAEHLVTIREINGWPIVLAAVAVVRKRVRDLEDIMEALAPVDDGEPADAGPSQAVRLGVAAVNALGEANNALDNLIDELVLHAGDPADAA